MNDTNTPSMGFEDAPLGWKPDDDKLAIHLRASLKDKLAYFYSAWRAFDEGCWRTRDGNEMRHSIRKELRPLREEHGINVNQTRIKSLVSMLEDELFIPDRKLIDQQQEQARYIPLRNGLFNLRTMQLEPHRPDLYFIHQLDFDYDPDAYSSTLHRYLNSSLVTPDGKPDLELKTLALEALGYSLTARTDMKSSFWLVGQKDSGKSTFITLIKSLLGDLHATIDLTQLATNRFLLAGIVGKRVISFTEASSNTMLPDALYKTLTGGSDEIYADVKNRDGITFRPECKVWWAMNETPRISDRSGATARRIVFIPFNRTIPEQDRIPNLEQLLINERAGIFNTVIDHLKRVNELGEFSLCAQSRQMLSEYIMENDTEATFVAERCERHESYKVRGQYLHDAYLSWCLRNGFHGKSRNQIAKDWRRLGFEQKTSDGSWWLGLRLRDDSI